MVVCVRDVFLNIDKGKSGRYGIIHNHCWHSIRIDTRIHYIGYAMAIKMFLHYYCLNHYTL